MSKSFTDMNKKELQVAAEFYGVADEIAELSKKQAIADKKAVPKVPTDETYIEVLEALKAERAEDPEVIAEADDSEPTVIGNAHSSAGKTIAQVREDYSNTKVEVLITDHDTSTSTEEEIEGKVVNISIGNKRGRTTVRVPLNAGKQYLPERTIALMREIMIPVNLKGSTARTKRRFGIEYTAGWTEEYLAKKIIEQKAKV